MQNRYFIVHFAEGVYSVKEVNPDIAVSIALYGVVTDAYHCATDACWYFYFMNTKVVDDMRTEVVQQLVARIQNEAYNPQS